MPRSRSLTRNRRDNQSNLPDARCVFYARASTDRQTNSIDSQLYDAKGFAQAHGLTIAKEFPDLDSSAVKINFIDRKVVADMLAYCKKHQITTILIHRADRAFRSNFDLALTGMHFDKSGIFLRLISPDIDMSTPMGKLFMQMLVGMAEMEIGIKSDRVDKGLDAMRRNRVSRNGCETAGNPNATAPYGWRNATTPTGTSATGKPIYPQTPVPEEQAVLQYILHRYQSNRSHGILTRISRELNMELQIPAPSAGKTLIKKGGIPYIANPYWNPAKVTSVIEHAIIAEVEELPALPTITTAASALRNRIKLITAH